MNSRARVLSVAIGAFAVVLVTPIASSATFPGDNGRIIFSRGSFEGPTFIASMEPDGSDVQRLTGPKSAFGASWDPDGSRFIYSRTNNAGTVDLFMRNADGSNPTRVSDTDKDEFQVAFGPNGNRVVYQKCGFQCDLFTRNLTTGNEARVTDTGRADEIAPQWSVDNLIVFERSPRRGDIEVFTIHPNGTVETQLTHNRRRADVSASWDPAGTRIVYSRCGFEGNCELFTMDPDGSGKDRITNTSADEFDAKYSPNGRSFVFTRSRGEGNSDLFRMRTNGDQLQRLTNTPNRFEVSPDWQPVI
ncbi:MAG: TolB family protein [Actinomycetota bacterium]|nr:PD40 domain-containing protein [Actinomycetota bacterium]